MSVFAATSLREALAELAAGFEREHGIALEVNIGASNALAQQILAAGTGDVFLSADSAQMDLVERAGSIMADTRAPLLSNQLVVVQPAPLPAGVPAITSAEGLADPRIERLSLANPEAVPAGRYAKAWLEARGLWGSVEARIAPAIDVRAALAAVESGAAEAGIVYATDAAVSTRVAVALRVPLDEGPRIAYAVAALKASERPELARAFVEHLQGVAARAVFERHGFLVLPSARSGIDADD
jgi:molybdate transport system substrate-binding protein